MVEKPKRLEDTGVDTYAHPRITGLYALKRRATGERALRHGAHREVPPEPGNPDIVAEFPQDAANGKGRTVRGSHM